MIRPKLIKPRRIGCSVPALLVLLLGPAGCSVPTDEAETDEPVAEVRQPLSFMPYLPYPAPLAMGVSQGWGGTWSHTGNLYYAIDFNLPGTGDLGIHVLAVGDGTVTYRYDLCTCDGCSCNNGWGNAIVIDHGGGEYSKYTHLITGSIPDWIDVGTPVCRGLHIGDLGTTGNSTGPHLHFQFQSAGTLSGPSIPFDRFQETSGVPVEGGSYTSQNQELAVCGPPPVCSISVGAGTTVIDELTDCFTKTGQWWWDEAYGHDGHHFYTYTIADPNPDSTGTWEINVETAGSYDVEVFVPNNPDSLTQGVSYTVRHNGSNQDAGVDQSANRGAWVLLGTYYFAAGGDQHVRIFDNTGEPYVDQNGRRLLVDAIRLTSVVDPPACSDDCTTTTERRCVGTDAWEECGYFDSDPCLEWGGGGLCQNECSGDGVCEPVIDPPVGGAGGTGGAGSTGGAGGSGDDGSSYGLPDTDEGCSCRLITSRSVGGQPAGWALLLLLGGALATWRRRRHSPTNKFGCLRA